MDEHFIVRSIVLRIGRGMPATSSIAKALTEWAQPHRDWLRADVAVDAELDWDALLAVVEQAKPEEAARPHALILAADLAQLLGLAPVDHALLTLMVACDRLPRVATLVEIASRHGHDLPTLLGTLAGARRRTRRAAERRAAPGPGRLDG